jgi:hypothetical protein
VNNYEVSEQQKKLLRSIFNRSWNGQGVDAKCLQDWTWRYIWQQHRYQPIGFQIINSVFDPSMVVNDSAHGNRCQTWRELSPKECSADVLSELSSNSFMETVSLK